MLDFESASGGYKGGKSSPGFSMRPHAGVRAGDQQATCSNRLTGLKLILLTEACRYTNVAAYRLVRPENRRVPDGRRFCGSKFLWKAVIKYL